MTSHGEILNAIIQVLSTTLEQDSLSPLKKVVEMILQEKEGSKVFIKLIGSQITLWMNFDCTYFIVLFRQP